MKYALWNSLYAENRTFGIFLLLFFSFFFFFLSFFSSSSLFSLPQSSCPAFILLAELNTSLIARFYKINFDSEIRNIHLLMGNPKEYLLSNGLMLVDCPRAEMTYVFDDDLQV